MNKIFSLKYWTSRFFYQKSLLTTLIIFSFVSLFSVYFLIPGIFNEIILPNNGDNNIAIGIMMHNMKAMAHLSFSDIYHFPIYFPCSFTLTAGVNFIGQSVLLLPFYLMGIKNVYFLYNLLLFVSLVLGGTAVYFFIKEFVDHKIIQLAGGAVYILLPLKQINYPHPHLLFFFFSIFAILFIIRYVRSFRRIDALLFYLFLFLQALFSITLFFLTSILSAVLFLVFIIIKREIKLKVLLELSIGLILLGVFIFFIFSPYITNPLNISYGKTEFSSRALLRSWDFYSTWFPLTFKFLRGRSTPLFLGFAASFLIFCYFYSKTKVIHEKIFSFLLFIFLTIPVLLTFYRGTSLKNLREVVDLLFVFFIIMFLINVMMIWRRVALEEKFVLTSLVFVFLTCFRSLFEYIPLKTNFFYVLSLIIPRLTRLRGFKFKYYFIVFWIALIFLGFKALIKNKKETKIKTVVVSLLVFLLLFENFPPPLETGRLKEHNTAEKALYGRVEKYPVHFGILELPHFRGFGDNKIFSLYTIYHNKHIYNGYYGIGVFDPLKIFKRQYFYPTQNIPDDINNKSILDYLKDNGIRIVIFHKSLMIFGALKREKQAEMVRKANELWIDIVEGFRKARNNGLLSELDILDNGIIAVISEEKKGTTFNNKFTYYYLKSKKYILIRMKRISEQPVEISVKLNGNIVFNDKMVKKYGVVRLKIPKDNELNARGNDIEIKCSEKVYLEKIVFLD